LLAHAVGLTSYADTNTEFAEQLALVVRQQNWQASEFETETKASKYLTPSDEAGAVSTGQWLFGNLAESKDIPYTKAYLTTWAADQEMPKNLFIGIIGMAIMGPTLGIVESTKKKKKSQLQIVIEDSYYQELSKDKLAKLTADLGQRVFSHEAKLAGGNIYQLHPDTAEWYMSEPTLKLYKVDQETLTELQAEAKNDSLATHTEYKNDHLVALAISPSIDNALVEDRDAKLI